VGKINVSDEIMLSRNKWKHSSNIYAFVDR